MTGPWAEDGRMPELTERERDLIAQHEQRIADRRREIDEEGAEDEKLQRLRDGLDEL